MASKSVGTSPRSFVVQGRVLTASGRPIPNCFVKAVDVDLRSEEILGTTTTNRSDGKYCITYTDDQFKNVERGTADLKVSAFESARSQIPLATSPIFWNAPKDCTIDVIVGGDKVIGPTEFQNLQDTIIPLLGKLQPKDLFVDDDHHDVDFLVNETGLLKTNIQLFILAYQVQSQASVQIDAEVLYGLFRGGLPTRLPDLVAVEQVRLTQALTTAGNNNIIRNLSSEEIDQIVAALHKEAVSRAAGSTANPTPVSSVLGTVLSDPSSFLEKLPKFQGDSETFWQSLSQDPTMKEKVPAIQSAVRLGVLTLNNASLMQVLQKRNIATPEDMATMSRDAWKSVIKDAGGSVPPEIAGDTADQKVANYVGTLMNIVEDLQPTKFVASQIAQDKSLGIPGQAQLTTFFQKNPTFDITKTRFDTFITNNPGSIAGIDNPDLLKKNMGSIQRIYTITSRFEQTKALVSRGINSSLQISQIGRSSFLTQFSASLGGDLQAIRIFDRAEQTHASAISLLSNYGWPGAKFPKIPVFTEPNIQSTDVDTGIPDMSTLFGSLDMCSCDECSSIDGPAAYLVDILHFLSERKLLSQIDRDPKTGLIVSVVFRTKTVEGSDAKVPMSVKDALFERRPDIGEVELNCQNTNTPVPYIDLTIEVLEDAVAPPPTFKSSPLNLANAGQLLDQGKITAELKQAFNPPLSDYAVLTVQRTHEWWTVDEPAYSYTVRRDDAGIVQIVSRNKQTKGTSDERLANPQYINSSAYDILRRATYPWNLPFDMWASTVQTYLAHVDVKRWRVMEVMSPILNREGILRSEDIAHERLGFSPFEADLLTTSTPNDPWTFWGFSAETLDATHGIPDPSDKGKLITGGLWHSVLTSRVDIFLRQSQLTYPQLLNLVQLSDIFGAVDPPLNVEAKEGADEDTCDLTLLMITGASKPQILIEIARFGKILLGLNGWTVLDLGKSIRALRSKVPSSDWFTNSSLKQLLVGLSHVLRLQTLFPDLELDAILAVVSKNIDITAYKDYQSDDENADTSSFYARVFRNKTVLDQPDTVFTGDPVTLSGSIMDFVPTITSALQISAADFSSLTKAVLGDKPPLSLENLSLLYRHTTIVQALGMSINNYLIMIKLYPVTDFFVDTAQTLIFIERTLNALSSPFTLPQLGYLLRHDFNADTPGVPLDDTIALVLSDLRTGLQKISLDNTFTADMLDQKGDITQKHLASAGWDANVVAQVISVFNDLFVWIVPLASPLPDTFNDSVPESLKGQILYENSDPSALRLSFSGVMTKDSQSALKSIPGTTADFKSAVDALFTNARNFLKRNMRFVIVPDYTTSLTAIPSSVSIPIALAKKVYFDPSTSLLHVRGAMTDDERTALLQGVDPTANKDYFDAINKLFSLPDSTLPSSDDDKLLDDQDISDLFDTAIAPTGEPNTPLERFTKLLKKLLPRLKHVLSRQFITQKVTEFLGIESQSTDNLLSSWMTVNGQPMATTFAQDSFVNSSLNSLITRSTFSDLFTSLIRLDKVASIVKSFKLTNKQLVWVFDFRKVSADPTTKWLDLNALPSSLVNNGDFEGWERLNALVSLRNRLPLGEQTLDSIFSAARKQNADMPSLWNQVATRTNWLLDDILTLAGTNGFNFSTPLSLQDEIGLTKFQAALDITKKIGCSAAEGIQYAIPEQTNQQARSVVQTIKAKYDSSLWQTVARPLRNILRDQQRKSLVSYLLVHSPVGVKPIWRNSNDLYAFYLMDVEMGPCQLTSRIKQAISVTQLFAQRCLMNLEEGIVANSEYDSRWEEWATLKNFRIASAARQVFEKPENFLDGSIRDDKTSFFQDMETDLQQADLTNDVAETAFMNYLEKLDEVAKLV
jgi:hypothetical protein